MKLWSYKNVGLMFVCVLMCLFLCFVGPWGVDVVALWCQSWPVECRYNCLSVPHGSSAVPGTDTTAAETVLWTQRSPAADVSHRHTDNTVARGYIRIVISWFRIPRLQSFSPILYPRIGGIPISVFQDYIFVKICKSCTFLQGKW